MSDDPRAPWAAVLDAPAGAPAEIVVATFLRSLPADKFVPPAERVGAANALAGTAAPVGRNPDAERLLGAEVDAFAAGYWDLEPAARLTRWSDLSRRGADAARLRELEPGLDVPVPPAVHPVADELARLVRELVVLPPRARAIRRNEWLLAHAAEAEKWRAASAALRRAAPELVELEPALRNALDPAFASPLKGFAARASAPPVPVVPSEAIDALRKAAKPLVEAARSVGGTKSGGNGWGGSTLGGGAVFVLFIIVKVVGALTNSSHTTPTYPSLPRVQDYSVPVIPKLNTPPAVRTFRPEEVDAFRKYEQERAAGKEPTQPIGYFLWIDAGCPPGDANASPTTLPRQEIQFSVSTIHSCQEFEAGRSTSKPFLYDLWLEAGKPTRPGKYPVGTPKPPR
jgi:hypothetical protein